MKIKLKIPRKRMAGMGWVNWTCENRIIWCWAYEHVHMADVLLLTLSKSVGGCYMYVHIWSLIKLMLMANDWITQFNGKYLNLLISSFTFSLNFPIFPIIIFFFFSKYISGVSWTFNFLIYTKRFEIDLKTKTKKTSNNL